ncbi:MAG: B12-binding domain-containing radical SAM protein [Acidobacteriota bacterium]
MKSPALKKSVQYKILLINPWIYDFTAYDFWMKPLGLLSVASLIQKHTPAQIKFIDCLDRHHPLLKKKYKTKKDGRGPFQKTEVKKPEVLKNVPRIFSRYGIPVELLENELDKVQRADLVLITCTMTYWYPGVQHVVEIVKKKFGNIPVVLGGVYPTLLPKHAKKESGADIIIQGPGEKKILPLLNKILGDKFCSPLQFENPDDLPFPAFHLLRNQESLPIMTSRGCPFNCSFCASPILYKNFIQRNPESVIKEITHIIHHYKTQNLAFYDDALLINKNKHLHPILEELIRRKLPTAFHTPNGLHIKNIDQKTADIFFKANFKSLFLSQETFDLDIINQSCPKIKPGDLEKAVQSLEQAGYEKKDLNVYLLTGLPGQNFFSVKNSIEQVKKLGLKPRLAYFSPVPHTSDWRKLISEKKLAENHDPLLHNKLAAPYYWGNISPQEFKALKNMIHL